MASLFLTVIPFIILIFGQSYFLGKYLSITREIFNGNFFGSLMIGFISYFATSFSLLFFFGFFNSEIIYPTVFHFIKDGILVTFLMLKRNTFVEAGFKINRREIANLLLLIISVVLLVVIFHFEIMPTRELEQQKIILPLGIWSRFKALFLVASSVSDTGWKDFGYWLGNGLISFLSIASIGAIVSYFCRRSSYLTWLATLGISVLVIFAVNFGAQIEGLACLYIGLFMFLLCVNIIIYSRRRYGAFFGVAVFAAWNFNNNYFLVYIIIAFSTSVIYTILRKPKVILIWVQLMAPLAVVATLWTLEYSKLLGLIITIVALIAYVFMIGVGRLETLDKLNNFFTWARYVIPVLIFLIITIIGLSIGVPQKEQSLSIIDKTYYMFDHQQKTILTYIDYALMGLVFLSCLSYVIYIWITKQKIRKVSVAIIMLTVFMIFGLNPGSSIIFTKINVLSRQLPYISTITIPILLCLLSGQAINLLHKMDKKANLFGLAKHKQISVDSRK